MNFPRNGMPIEGNSCEEYEVFYAVGVPKLKPFTPFLFIAIVMGCGPSSDQKENFGQNYQSQEEVLEHYKGQLAPYSYPLSSLPVEVNGKASPHSRICVLPDWTYFIQLDKSHLSEKETEGTYALQPYNAGRLALMRRTEQMLKEDRWVFLQFPVTQIEISPEAGDFEIKRDPKIEFTRTGDHRGISFETEGGLHVFVPYFDPKDRAKLWIELDKIFDEGPRNPN